MNTHQHNLHVITASAGSGKTYNLAKSYIEQLLWARNPETGETRLRDAKERNYHEHMLAITFTNKATDEMKQRIVGELYNLAQGQGSYLDDFIKTYGNSKPDIQAAAQRALADVMHGYSKFNVSTIDSFFQNVVRTFAHELNCDYNYELQLDDKFATNQAVLSFKHDLGTPQSKGTQIDQWVKEFIKDQTIKKGNWNFYSSNDRDGISRFAQVINKEKFRNHHQEIRDYLNGHAGKAGLSPINKFIKAVASKRIPYDKTCASISTDLTDFFNKYGFTIDEREVKKNSIVYTKLLRNIEPTSDNIVSLKHYTLQGNVFKAKTQGAKMAPDHEEEFHGIIMKYLEAIVMKKELDSLLDNIWQLGLLGAIDKRLEEMNQENETILIADTNELVSKVLKSDVPFVYERIGTWFNNFMIDEFQDTNRKQYENFKPLLDNSLSTGHSNLVIGDVKQSIYRFRDSDPDILAKLLPDYFKAYYNPQSLDTNYRSFERVVTFNNSFFKALLKRYADEHPEFEKLQVTYSNLEQKVQDRFKKQEPKGYVKINFIYTEKDSESTPHRSDEQGTKLNDLDQVLNGLPQYILDLKRKHGFDFKDILILVNTNKEGNMVVERFLSYNATCLDVADRIDLMSNESLLLKNSPAVRLIMSVLRFVDATQYQSNDEDERSDDAPFNPADKSPEQLLLEQRLSDQYRYKVLHDFGKKLGEQACGDVDCGALLAQCFKENETLRSATIDEQIEQYSRELESLMPKRDKELTTLTGLVDKIIDEYIASTNLSQGTETAFLLAFQNLVLDFCSQRNCGGTVHEFIKYWDQKKDKAVVPSGDNDNAVRIMTIHSSKGLEAPCVVIPFANWDMVRPDPVTWIEKDLWLKAGPFMGIWKDDQGNDIVPPLIPVTNSFLKNLPEFSGYYDQLTQDDLIDKVNKTYVAFTRAAQQLHIFAMVPKANTDYGQVGRLLYELTQGRTATEQPAVPGAMVHPWKETHPLEAVDDDVIDYLDWGWDGEQYVPKGKGDEHEVEKAEMPDYAVNSALNGDLLRVKLPESTTAMQDDGTRMHRVMSMIKHPGDEKRALHYALKRGLLADDDNATWSLSRVAGIIERMYRDPRTRDWFAPGNKVYNERPILVPIHSGEEYISKRPDRIVVRPDGTTIVIDYKFGASHSKEQLGRYERQVQDYMRLLQLAGHSTVVGYLWLVASDQVVPVAADPQLDLGI